MIPLDKLARLPRHQRLRKAEKILAAVERQLRAGLPLRVELPLRTEHPFDPGRGAETGGTPAAAVPPAYLAELLGFLAGDGEFSPPQRQVFEEAALACRAPGLPPAPDAPALPDPLRTVNAACHALRAATGRYPADWDFTDGEGALDGTRRRVFPGMWVYLEDIRSPFNVGAMFRAAESFGVEKLWLSPLCADPRHRRAQRTAMGCVDILPWERETLEGIPPRAAGPGGGTGLVPCFALETGGSADFVFPPEGLLIVGSEELGVSPAALERADASLGRLSIRTYGAKGSLNASVAYGIALHQWAEALAGRGPAAP
jgi:TrmH family RNA methyltransferase